MFMHNNIIPAGWLAFELSVLRRLKFKSVAIPFAGEPHLGLYLKRWGARVAANDLMQWAWTKASARIENNAAHLSEEDVEMLLEDTYLPGDALNNPALLKWFNETDAFWFDNLRINISMLDSEVKRSLALSTGMAVGDYVLSFDEETRSLRQPLSLQDVFRRAWASEPAPVNNSQRNTSSNAEARAFLAEQHTDLLFLRLPLAAKKFEDRRRSLSAWREEWVRGGDGFWDEIDRQQAGRLGSHAETKQQYLRFLEDLLHTAAHLRTWAIAFTENGFVSTSEIVETIARVRRVDSIYTKDFSELMGVRATIITT